jgi:hypothetical protein
MKFSQKKNLLNDFKRILWIRSGMHCGLQWCRPVKHIGLSSRGSRVQILNDENPGWSTYKSINILTEIYAQ